MLWGHFLFYVRYVRFFRFIPERAEANWWRNPADGLQLALPTLGGGGVSGVGLRATVLRALEALADGDPVLAEEILEGLAHELETELITSRGTRCGICGLRFDWPGQLAEHLRFVHWGEPWKRPA